MTEQTNGGSDLASQLETALTAVLATDPQRLVELLALEQTRRHQREMTGLWLTSVLLLCFGAAALTLGLRGHDWLAGVVFSTTVLGVATIFVLRERPPELPKQSVARTARVD
jgi:hypothetical protein